MTSPVNDDKPVASRLRTIVTVALGPIILVIASLLVGVVHVPQHSSLSVADEYVYIDYLSKVPHQLVVHQGEETDTYARQSLMCRGLWHVDPFPASNCTTAAFENDSLFPYDGRTSADIYTPLYFVVTWALAQPFHLLGIDDLANAGRFAGTIWLAAAALVLYAAARRLKIGRPLATGTGLLMVGSLAAWWANTYVSTDATALLAGSTMLYLAITASKSTRIHWWFVALSMVATLFKLQNFAAVGVACLYLLAMAARDAFRGAPGVGARVRAWCRDRRTWTAVLAIVLSLGAQGAWLYYRAVTTEASTKYEGLQAPLKLSDLFTETFRFFSSTGYGASAPSELGRAAVALGTITMVVTVVGVIGLIATAKPGSRSWILAFSVLLVALLIGPALALSTYLSTGVYFPLPTRYGTSLFPFALICAALLVQKRRAASGTLIGLAALSYGLSLAVPG